MVAILLRVLGGLVLAGIGFGMIVKSDIPLELIGTIDWAERQFGPGGSRLFWKLVGVAVALVGMAVAAGLGPSIFMGSVGKYLVPAQTR
jgi:hypothetical protein